MIYAPSRQYRQPVLRSPPTLPHRTPHTIVHPVIKSTATNLKKSKAFTRGHKKINVAFSVKSDLTYLAYHNFL